MFKRAKVVNHFRSKLAEHAVTIDNVAIVNMAVSDETVLFYFGHTMKEFYKKDAIKIVDDLIASLQTVSQHLKE